MNTFLKRNYLVLAGLITGTIGGYAYYYFIGCATGTCPLTANPYISIGFGAVIGALLFDMFKKKEATDEKN